MNLRPLSWKLSTLSVQERSPFAKFNFSNKQKNEKSLQLELRLVEEKQITEWNSKSKYNERIMKMRLENVVGEFDL